MGTWNSKFRNTALIAGILATLAVSPAMAGDSHIVGPKRAGVGFLGGAAIGAAAGGPVGAVVGAAVGVVMGDRSQQKTEALKARKAESERLANESQRLANESQRLASESRRLATDVESLNHTLGVIETKAAAMGSTVQFRTGETSLRDSDKARIQRLGALVADLDGVRVRVTGFADSRGDDELNQALSQERAEMVARELEQAGVPKQRLVIEAMGERFANVDATPDDQAFERSVEIHFESAAALASN